MLNRRKALRLFGMAPAAGVLAKSGLGQPATPAIQMEAAKLSGVMLGGVTGYQDQAPIGDENQLRQYAHIFVNKLLRKELETLLYEDERYVTRIDPDLASKRSFSLSAKVAFQRQRNVARRMEELQSNHSWQRVHNFLLKNRMIDAIKAVGAGLGLRSMSHP